MTTILSITVSAGDLVGIEAVVPNMAAAAAHLRLVVSTPAETMHTLLLTQPLPLVMGGSPYSVVIDEPFHNLAGAYDDPADATARHGAAMLVEVEARRPPPSDRIPGGGGPCHATACAAVHRGHD